MYGRQHKRRCTLVCEAAIGRMHSNDSLEVPGQAHTVAKYDHPKAGFDAMYGMGGSIVVVPSPARVRVTRMLVHAT